MAAAGLNRIHLGLESGDDDILARGQERRRPPGPRWRPAGWRARRGWNSTAYVILGLGGQERTASHARETARVINEMAPDVVRLRTLVPKINTPLLADIQAGRFQLLGPHGVIRETMALIEAITVPTRMTSDHYTNYVNVAGQLAGR